MTHLIQDSVYTHCGMKRRNIHDHYLILDEHKAIRFHRTLVAPDICDDCLRNALEIITEWK